MNDPIAGIQEIGRRLAALKSSDEELYQAVRTLDRETAEALKDANEKNALAVRPVNLLRYEILRRVLNDEAVDADVTERIQAAIQSRDTSAFRNAGYPRDFVERLRTADLKKNVFRNWQVQFRVCYPFFFAGDDRRRVRELLDTVAREIKRELDLESHGHRCFTFDGPNNLVTRDAGWQSFHVNGAPTPTRFSSFWGSIRRTCSMASISERTSATTSP